MTNSDNVLNKSAGSGKFQTRTSCLLGLINCIAGANVLASIFTLHTPPHRCTIPEMDWTDGTPSNMAFTVSNK